ncbi:amino acid adenylation domain-containing protein [Streptomyces cinerochromogenes]|uniref:amino acid adenylation domain-containing protein n=1 Tax=Streptomyces cinerochromogenes TaxID=66422 RepID=UPI003683450C
MKHELSALIADYRAGKITDVEVGDLLRRLRQGARTYPLTEGQRGLWALQQAFPDATAYNVPLCFRVRGLDTAAFLRAWRAVAEVHPVLTTVLGGDADGPHQSVDPGRAPDFAEVDLAALPDAEALAAVEREHKRPFATDGEALVRIRVFARPSDESIVLVSVHHIVFDGTSARILMRALFEAYERVLAGAEPAPAAPAAQFHDFVERQRATPPARRAELLAHWRQKLAGPLPTLNLPTDRPHSQVVDRFAGDTCFTALPAALAAGIAESAARWGVTPAALMLGAYGAVLATYSQDREFVVGVPVNERTDEALADAMGFMINMVPVRMRLAADEPFRELVGRVQRDLVDGMLHSCPFAALAAGLPQAPAPDRSPVFQTAFVYQDVLAGIEGPGLPYELLHEVHQEGEYELSVEAWRTDDGYTLHWKYHPELYSREFVERFADRYLRLLLAVTGEPAVRVGELCRTADAPGTVQGDGPCVHDMVEAAVRRHPDAVAVEADDEVLTYAELGRRSDALAAHLAARGVRRGDLVTVLLDRSAAVVVALLGILKAGAAYVPLDPELPAARLSDIVTDSGTTLVVTQSRHKEQARALLAGRDVRDGGGIVVLDEQRAELAEAAARGERAEVRATESDLAYVIYTSGSTGKPKGVMIPHRGFTNLLRSLAEEPGLDRTDTLFAVTTISFDMAQVELFLPLVRGGRCHVCDSATLKDVDRLKERIARVRPTVMQATPAAWSMLFHSGWRNPEGLRAFCGGEALSRTLKEQFLSTGTELWNLYGPTETTVYSTGTLVRADAPITIGRPLANTEALILDERLRPVPAGESGELCIAGTGLADGYVNRPELTAERFVDRPSALGGRIYRTGDLARWTDDGEIEYLGRLDFQVKIRGYRIELGDIEYHLGRHEDIAQCVVVARGEDAAKHLVAYYVPAGGRRGSAATFKEHLRASLPAYMVPDFYVALDAVPLTGSGKVDRNALMRREISRAPEPDRAAAPQPLRDRRSSRAETEQRVLACWREVLQVADIAPTDSFFEVGGNSLAAVLLAQRISGEFQTPFAAADLFKHSSVRAIAEHLSTTAAPHEETFAGTDRPAQDPSVPQDPSLPQDAIAVVGIACRFADADDQWEFWENLTRGDAATRWWSEPELRDAGVPEHLLRDPRFVPLRSSLDGKELFDGEFFRLSPHHVALMDPQFRQLLPHAWKAVEDAGYNHHDIPGTAVYVTHGNHFYGAPADGAPTGVVETPEQYLSWVMSQSGTVAAMISQQLGFGGPSMSVHSNCSSSLTALSLAAQAVRSGETDFALVAAASAASVDSRGYVHQPGLNLSGDGRVKAFDADADGMAGGEGVAVLLIRRAADAVAAGDHIYGLLRGIAVGSDGADATGFYSPSVTGQSRVIRSVLQRTGIDPRSIGYVEAHGTGTKLGDPVELAALTEAYRDHTDATGYCGIGSVKSNLGHLDAAAGLAGSIKVLLSLHHRQIPPTLHYTRPNPELRLDRSPFHVVDTLREWPAGPAPRRAAQSSIGLGGANAHAVFEEYATGHAAPADDGSPQLVPLSARAGADLDRYARDLLAHLRGPRAADARLRDLAYTLQVGRVPMAARVAFVVRDLGELAAELTLFLDGADSSRRFTGDPAVPAPEHPAAKLARWWEKGKLRKLAKAWTDGADVGWARLTRPAACRRLSLPTYPFRPVVHPWPARTGTPAPGAAAPAHPLLHENVSGLGAVRYRSRFTGEEFVLRDHVVGGRRLLPAVASLEMAYTAARRAVPRAAQRGITLRNVTWVRPVAVDGDGLDVGFTLAEDRPGTADGPLRFELTAPADGSGQVRVQGRAVLADTTPRPSVDLDGLRAALTLRPLTGAEAYDHIARAGVDYGPGFRVVRTLWRGGDEGRREVLAELRLDEASRDSLRRYALHPALLDGAIHASLGLHPALDTTGARLPDEGAAPAVPFALDRLDVFADCDESMYAWVRPAAGAEPEGVARVLDIDLTDARGRVCAALRGLAYRAAETGEPTAVERRNSALRTLLPVWEPRNLALPADDASGEPGVVLVFDADRRLGDTLTACAPGHRRVPLRPGATVEEIAGRIREACGDDAPAHLVWAAPRDGGDLVRGQEQGVIEVYRIVRALLSLGYGTRRLTWTCLTYGTQRVEPGDRVAATHASVHGLMGSAAREHARWTVRLLDLPGHDTADVAADLRRAWHALPGLRPGTTLALRDGRWFSSELLPVPALEPAAAPYRDGGCYVVIGGAGGLGELWSRYMVEHHRAAIVWIGRRQPDEDIERRLAALAALARSVGADAPLYVPADARDADSLAAAHRRIKESRPRIDGVVHSAIVLADKTLAHMDEERFRDALAAKVDVGAAMARVFGAEPLDLVLFFSSVESHVRDAGQANYAAGCTFKDALAAALRDRWPDTVVKTVNWGYWGATGVVSGDFYRSRMAAEGIDSLDPEEALRHLAHFLGGAHDQVTLMRTFGDRALDDLALAERRTAGSAPLPPVLDQVVADHRPPAGEVARLSRFLPHPRLCALAERLLFTTLHDLGPDGLERRVLGAYRPWLEESDRVLTRAGLLQVADGRRVALVSGLDSAELWRQWHEERGQWHHGDHQRAHVDLVESCLRALPDVLVGARPATEILFPGSSLSRVEGIYRGDPIADYFNDRLAELLADAVRRWGTADPARRLRILEVGAGTGATSARVLRALAPLRERIEEYCYTDLSKAFLFRAEEQLLPDHPYLTTRILDAERPPGEQGLEPGSFDIVVATNVLHATADITRTLRNVKAALRPGGLLFLNEMSRNTLLAHLTFGLVDGWWRTRDAELRIPGSPVLSPDRWLDVLDREGFRTAVQPEPEAHALGQQLTVAESDGLFRVPRTQDATGRPEPVRTPPVSAGAGADGADADGTLRARTTEYVAGLLREALRLPDGDLDPHKDLYDYGLDSILVSGLNNALARDFEDVGSTLFFELRTLDELVDHFLTTRESELRRLFGSAPAAPSAPAVRSVAAGQPVPAARPRPAGESRVDRTTRRVTELVAATLRLAPGELSPDANLFDLGLDSILVVQLNNALSQDFEGLSSTLFFDCPTVRDVVARLVAEHPEHPEHPEYAELPELPEHAEHAAHTAHAEHAEQPERSERVAAAARPSGDIAVVGLAGRYPQADGVLDLWENVREGRNCTAPYPADRWWVSWDEEGRRRPYGGFLDDVASFDAEYFGIPADEAAAMDPQERLFIETVHSCLQDAGYTADALNRHGRVGVFAGVMNATYNGRTAYSSIVNRTSHLFDFQGASIAVDTACSSSLTAVHLAVESLRSGDTDCAVAGGVNLLLNADHFDVLAEHGLLSESDRCRPFSEHADGFLAAEGVGAVLLRPLQDALDNGDHVYAVIKGSAVNAGGRTSRYSMPSPQAQRDVVARALEKAGVAPATVSYVEAHGTATALGDSIEISALSRAFGSDRAGQYCAVGSLKSNLGHCESASGLAGLTKVLLQMRHGQLAPSINAEELNTGIVFHRSPFRVQRELAPWAPTDAEGRPLPRRAGISCFGAGGSNAHLIIEEHPGGGDVAPALEHPHDEPCLVPLSARTPEELRAVTGRLADFLADPARAAHPVALRDLAHTLQVGRDELPVRLAYVVRSTAQLAARLTEFRETGRADADEYADLTGEPRPGPGRSDGPAALGTDPHETARRWLAGAAVSWDTLYAGRPARRVSLPTHPFRRTPHWYTQPAPVPAPAPNRAASAPSRAVSVPAEPEGVRPWLRRTVAAHLGCDPSQVPTDRDLTAAGLSSMALVRLGRQLQDLDAEFDTALLFEYGTVDALAAHLTGRGVTAPATGQTADGDVPHRTTAPAVLRHPLTEGQQGLWALHKAAPEAGVYNVPLCFRVTGLDVPALRDAFDAVRNRHAVLRGAVREEHGRLLLVEAPAEGPWPTEHDLTARREAEVLERVRASAKATFDLERGPLCRIAVFHGPDGDSWVLLNAHHIVLDGASAVVLVKELLTAYQARVDGTEADAFQPTAAYAEFVALEEAGLRAPDAGARLAYWRDRLTPPLPALALPADRPRSAHPGPVRGATATRRLSPELGERITRAARDHRLYPSALFLAAYQVLLSRYTQQSDVIVGAAVNTRPAQGFAATVGHFVNMMPVRIRVSPAEPFADLAADVQKTLVEGLSHACPFPALVRGLGLSGAGTPVFTCAFMYQDWYEDVTAPAPSFRYVEGIHQEGEYELVLEVVAPGGHGPGFAVNCKYDAALFDPQTIEQLLRQYEQLLRTASDAPGLPVDECSLLSPEERHTLTVEWNATQVAQPDRCVHELFAEQAARTPDAVAVVSGADTLTYAELDARVTGFAGRLAALGVGPGSLVAVYMERSAELLVALLGTMRAGGAYIPLDPGYPGDRLAYILADSRPRVVVSDSGLRDRLRELTTAASAPHVVLIDEEHGDDAPWAGPRHVGGADLAYVIYTSGSTGNPKGVMVPHRALTNFLCAMARRPGLTADDRMLAVTTHSFDIAALELFLPLVTGARCHMSDPATARDPERLKELIGTVRPTVMQATPSTWTMLFHAGWTNEERVRVLCGGEALPETLRERLVGLGCEAWNLFGPTETTVWSTAGRIEPHRRVTIGRPIDNTRVHLLDERGRLVPAGVPGELCIAGDGLALGYLNKPELTAERFPDNPFAPGTRLYRTGDLARWLSDGSLECLGRIDSQVKIRGFRVELGEIEHVLAGHPAVHECAVVARTQSASKQLVAYYTRAAGTGASTGELAAHLRRRLPDYMVPPFLLPVDRLPRTPNGKVDRRALEERDVTLSEGTGPAVPDSRPDAVPDSRPDSVPDGPATARPSAVPDEADVLALWRDVLGVGNLRPTDAFLDAGGSSVLAAVLADRAGKRYGLPFGAAEVFRCVSARGMSEHLTALGTAPGQPDPAARRAPAPVAPVTAPPAHLGDSVAVIGVSCRLPGADDHHAFWRNLVAGQESVEFFSERELRRLGVDEELLAHPDYVPVRSAMRGKGHFDPEFFHITPRDAELMDPQLRLLLQHSWKAVEDAGHLPGDITDAAVYMSTSNALYQAPLAGPGARRDSEGLVAFLQAQPGTIPTTISHRLGLRGPSLYVHSNCSSSLAGLALAVQSIQSGQTRHALVGGASVYGEHAVGYLHEEGMTLSADGHCKPFSADADGMVGGEGVVVLLLKDAAAAVRDGDHVYALLRGVGMNNDGDRKAGYYAPSVSGQTELISAVLDRTGVHPETIAYLEAHGTGTRLGDPIEVMAVSEAYRRHTTRTGFCGIGSVKSNLGHLDAAAGLAGVLKTALVLGNRLVPPTVNHSAPNPQIDFASSPFHVVDRLTELTPANGPLRAAVSSFGIGGTNVHAILEEAPSTPADEGAAGPGPWLVPLSAAKPENLRRYARDLADRLAEPEGTRPGRRLADVAYTLQVGRTAMAERVAFVVHDLGELVQALTEFAAGRDHAACVRGSLSASPGLLDQDDLRALTGRWLAEGRLDKLARLWADGGSVDWHALHTGEHRPRRTSLPTYPFSEEYHWLGADPEEAGPKEPGARGHDAADAQPHFFAEHWVPQAAAATPAAGDQVILCFLSGQAAQREYARELRERAPGVRPVFVGRTGSGEDGSGARVADPTNEDGLRRVLAEVAGEYGRIDAVHYLWPAEHRTEESLLEEPWRVATLARALAGTRPPVPRVLVAGHFRDAVEEAVLDSLIGYERSLPELLPGTSLRVVLHDGEASAARWAGLLLTEQLQERPVSALYRAGARHVSRVQPVDVGTAPGARPGLRTGGTYLVTGAFGGLGRRVTEHLARTYRANLVLVGRSAPLPADEDWMRALRRHGADVVRHRLDMSDQNAVVRLLATLPALDGVLHAAGTADAVPLPDKTRASFEKVLGPKLHGTLALDRALRDAPRPPAFVCHFSSSAAVLGDFGSCDYAVANRFQAAYARALRDDASPVATIAVQWPLWTEGGMGAAARRGSADTYLAATGQRPLDSAQGLAVLERLLTAGHAAPLVLHAPAARATTLVRRAVEPAAVAERHAAEPSSVPARPAREQDGAGSAPAAPRPDLAETVREVVRESLKLPAHRLDDRTAFVDLGLDSLRLTQLAHQLSERLGVRLLPTVLYDHPTVERLAGHLAAAAPVDARPGAAAPREAAEPVAPPPPAPVPAGGDEPVSAQPPAPVAAGRDEPVAVIGMSGIFPGCRSVAEFWDALVEGRDMVKRLPAVRFGDAPAPDGPDDRYPWMGSIDWADEFDAGFFEFAPKEARTLDPRQRHLLQECWKALEDAALGAEELKGRRVGVFVGVEQGDYQLLVKDGGNVTSNHDGVLAARLSYFMDLKGPVLAVNTSCSSGLVALHQACTSLRQKECDIAVVAAANLVLTPEALAAMNEAGMLSPEGRCFTFDQRADGMVPGEAVTALVLRPLDAAEAHGDPVRSVIVASGLNYDGRTNGITAPAGEAQRELIESVQERAGIDPRDLGLVVAHGTGTKLGDPVEANALRAAFHARGAAGAGQFCALTSTKTNFGHTFAASGLVGLMCLSESVRRGVVPASLHYRDGNEYIDWSDSPFYVNTATKPWVTEGRPRMGAVSAFGMSGTNAHVVVREHTGPAPVHAPRATSHLLPLSAKTQEALGELVDRLLDRIDSGGLRDADLPRLSRTLFSGRHHFRHRCAVVVGTLDEAAALWRAWRADGSTSDPAWFAGTVARDFSVDTDGESVAAWTARARDGQPDTTERRTALTALARLYAAGHDVPCPDPAPAAGPRPARLRLPTYPFARTRYWVRRQAATVPQTAVSEPAVPQAAASESVVPLAAVSEPALPQAAASEPAAPQAAASLPAAAKAPAASAPRGTSGGPAARRVVLTDVTRLPHRLDDGTAAPRRTVTLTALTAPPAPAGPAAEQPAAAPRPVTLDHDILDDLKSAADIDFGGMVATLNRTGVMVEHLIPYSSDFAEYAGGCGGEVLDLGCAYGVASIAALERGARVVALDMERKHLDILGQRVTDEARKRLTLQQGVLPDVDFADGRFTAVHASRVMHFLGPDDVRLTLRKMFRWLAPGGKVFLSTDSPYFGYWASKAAEYEERRRAGDPWPGYIPDVAAHFDPAHVVGGPSLINALDPEVFRRECEAAGFVVERAGYFGAVGVDEGAYGAPGPDMEHVGIIARKPDHTARDAAGAVVRSADGLPVHHRLRGGRPGAPALVFVHGLGCDQSYWDRQAEHFAGDFTVVTLDLAGHGRSGRERRRWTVEAFAADVAAVVDHVGAQDVILVGHSLGGPVMLAAEPLLTGRVRGMIGVDTLHTFDPRPLTEAQIDRFVRTFAEDPVRAEELFLDARRADLIELVERTRAHVGAEIVSAAFREMLTYLQHLPHHLAVPLVLVNSTSWMPTDTDSAARRGVEVELVEGVGHFAMLEDPDALNASLTRHVRRITGAAPKGAAAAGGRAGADRGEAR